MTNEHQSIEIYEEVVRQLNEARRKNVELERLREESDRQLETVIAIVEATLEKSEQFDLAREDNRVLAEQLRAVREELIEEREKNRVLSEELKTVRRVLGTTEGERDVARGELERKRRGTSKWCCAVIFVLGLAVVGCLFSLMWGGEGVTPPSQKVCSFAVVLCGLLCASNETIISAHLMLALTSTKLL